MRILIERVIDMEDIHIRIGENNPLSSNSIGFFCNFLRSNRATLTHLKLFIGKRNAVGSKLFSELKDITFPKLNQIDIEIGNNNDKLSSDSSFLFDFLAQ